MRLPRREMAEPHPQIEQAKRPPYATTVSLIVKISVFASDANPAIDKRLLRRSRQFCEAEVIAGRATLITEDIWDGIQLVPTSQRTTKVEARGSKEQSGALTAHESALNAECRVKQTDVSLLARVYEDALEAHILAGKKGTPRACNVIAARVKTVLSKPTVRVTA